MIRVYGNFASFFVYPNSFTICPFKFVDVVIEEFLQNHIFVVTIGATNDDSWIDILNLAFQIVFINFCFSKNISIISFTGSSCFFSSLFWQKDMDQ